MIADEVRGELKGSRFFSRLELRKLQAANERRKKNYTVDLNNHQKHTICKTFKANQILCIVFFPLLLFSHHTTSSSAANIEFVCVWWSRAQQRWKYNFFVFLRHFCGPENWLLKNNSASINCKFFAVIVDVLMVRRICDAVEDFCWFLYTYFAKKATTICLPKFVCLLFGDHVELHRIIAEQLIKGFHGFSFEIMFFFRWNSSWSAPAAEIYALRDDLSWKTTSLDIGNELGIFDWKSLS